MLATTFASLHTYLWIFKLWPILESIALCILMHLFICTLNKIPLFFLSYRLRPFPFARYFWSCHLYQYTFRSSVGAYQRCSEYKNKNILLACGSMCKRLLRMRLSSSGRSKNDDKVTNVIIFYILTVAAHTGHENDRSDCVGVQSFKTHALDIFYMRNVC